MSTDLPHRSTTTTTTTNGAGPVHVNRDRPTLPFLPKQQQHVMIRQRRQQFLFLHLRSNIRSSSSSNSARVSRSSSSNDSNCCFLVTAVVAVLLVVALASSTFVAAASFVVVLPQSSSTSSLPSSLSISTTTAARRGGGSLPISSSWTKPSPRIDDVPSSTTTTRLGAAANSSPSSTGGADTTTTNKIMSWDELIKASSMTSVGRTLNDEVELRKQGRGSPHVQNTLRLFDSNDPPSLVLYRDHAGWCPYCQKTMLLVEEKQIPIQISLVNMRSYGDKPSDFLRKVPGGLLPALELLDQQNQIVTESQVIMELLDEWHPSSKGYRPMLPDKSDNSGWNRYRKLARLERELFSWWCTLVFRPEGPATPPPPPANVKGGGNGNPLLSRIMGGSSSSNDAKDYPHSSMPLSTSMRGFLDCMATVNDELLSTSGPWFFDTHEYPTMIDFIYVSHVERMLASCAYWKGLDLRHKKWNFQGLTAWLEAFEKREAYLAFTSDYYTHVMDIPPQYGPGFDGGFDKDRRRMQAMITGQDGRSWTLPLSFDDPLQPLYKGPPLPLCVLEAVGLQADADGSYENCDPLVMERACREMAAWKLAGNGDKVAAFAARGGPKGSKNQRKSFGAPLADPYAEPDANVQPSVDAALRIVCQALLDTYQPSVPEESTAMRLRNAVPDAQKSGVASSLAYLRDRVGVPRDLPLAAARYLRAYLNWAVDELSN